MEEEAHIVLKWFSETNIQAALMGPAAACLGYFVHWRNSKKVVLSNLIQEIELMATEHWCSPATDEGNRWRCIQLQHKFKTLGWKINQKNISQRNALTEYRKAVTGDDFDSPERAFVPYEHTRISLISQHAKDLRSILKLSKDH